MFRELRNEAKITFILRTKSPLSIRSKKTNVLNPSLPDMQCIRSRYQGEDSVIIPGSSLKGVIRNRYERIVSLFGGTCCNVVSRNDACKKNADGSSKSKGELIYHKMCPACKLFGSTSISSRIRILDAYPTDQIVMGERAGVGINRITGAAQKGALYDFEVVEEGSFKVEMFLKNYELYQLVLLLHVFKDLNEGYVSIGAASTRGNGRMEVNSLSIDFREYRENINCLQDFFGDTALANSSKYNLNYQWTNGFYGEIKLNDLCLDDLLDELKDVKIKEKLRCVNE